MLVKNVGCSGDCGKLINCARYLAPFLSSLTLRPCSFSSFIYSHLPFNFWIFFAPALSSVPAFFLFLCRSGSHSISHLWAKVAQLICMAKKTHFSSPPAMGGPLPVRVCRCGCEGVLFVCAHTRLHNKLIWKRQKEPEMRETYIKSSTKFMPKSGNAKSEWKAYILDQLPHLNYCEMD